MISRKIKSVEDFKSAVTEVALGDNPDILVMGSLTPRRMYAQFCYRMAKFDSEFSWMDPVIAGQWLNIGVSRLIGEMTKRMYKDANDINVQRFFYQYMENKNLDPIKKEDGDFYRFGGGSLHMYSAEPLNIYVSLNDKCWYEAGNQDLTTFPEYIPYSDTADATNPPYVGYRNGKSFKVAYRELSDSEYKNLEFYTANSFSSGGMYPPKVYVHWHTTSDVDIIFGNKWQMDARRSADKRQEPQEGFWQVDSVQHDFFYVEKIYRTCFIDTVGARKNDPYIQLPLEFHNDIVDYALDAFFEANFFQSFGKYSLKQARQDADTQANISGTRQHKLDAVPPQRYRLAAGVNAGPQQGGH